MDERAKCTILISSRPPTHWFNSTPSVCVCVQFNQFLLTMNKYMKTHRETRRITKYICSHNSYRFNSQQMKTQFNEVKKANYWKIRICHVEEEHSVSPKCECKIHSSVLLWLSSFNPPLLSMRFCVVCVVSCFVFLRW